MEPDKSYESFEYAILCKHRLFLENYYKEQSRGTLGLKGDDARIKASRHYNLHLAIYKKIIEEEYKAQFINAQGNATLEKTLMDSALNRLKELFNNHA